ncbi:MULTISPECIES: molybdopterin molybdotransferase MoeA [unclassified Acidovorax]|uniref:molybdopterin molybdotransferase MoeA n=1 Tax=unclassified Acidovorax TaxID=2684926 RepID=UPI0028831330|nr:MULTISPECIES: molybdopterin molybdotransferase MoeA [unclassified Acidovorax]
MKTIAQIAAELAGYDPQALSAAGVNDFLERLVQPVAGTEAVGVFAALDRVLAGDIVSPLNVPPHDNSAMDGYAFDGSQLRAGEPLSLRCVGTALAGAAWAGTVGAGDCVKIMTGAVMPAGTDTVVPQELTTQDPGTKPCIHIAADVLRPGDNRRLMGEDLMHGQVALAGGTRLGPAALGLLASLGLLQVTVVRRLRVAYFSTGDEILSLGEPPREGAVYDSNRYTVFGLLTRLGVEVIDLGVVKDDPALLEAAFREAATRADAIITSGGVSAGEADHTRAMMSQLGDVAFWRIAMRPGRPMAVGRIGCAELQAKLASSAYTSSASSYQKHSNQDALSESAVLFGLPGNPVAVMVTFLAFVRPALLRMMGSTEAAAPLLRAVCTEPLRKKAGRTEYQRGWVCTAPDGTLQVRSTGNQGSGMLSSMVQANGLIVLHHAQGPVAAGDVVDVMMFEGVV